jgi:hypothetical protein
LIILNQTIQTIVKDEHHVSMQEIKQQGTTSSLIFYSHPMKSSEKFILTLSREMFQKDMEEKLTEDTLFHLSGLILDSLLAVQAHRRDTYPKEYSPESVLWTMNESDFVSPVKNVVRMLSQLIRRNESKNLNEKLFTLSRVLLKELEFAKCIEQERSNEED